MNSLKKFCHISKSEEIHSLKNSVLEDCGYIQKNIVLNFSQYFLLLLLFSIYKMVDSMYIHEPININIETIMKKSRNAKIRS